jgi:hypothetical protein
MILLENLLKREKPGILINKREVVLIMFAVHLLCSLLRGCI